MVSSLMAGSLCGHMQSTEIRTRNGKILYHRREGPATQVVDPQAVEGVNDMLRAVVAGGTGQGANPGRPAAGKTGTPAKISATRGSLAIPAIWSQVWMGNDDSSPETLLAVDTERNYGARIRGRRCRPAGLTLPPLPSAAMSSESGSSFLNWLKTKCPNVRRELEDQINSE